MFFQKAPKDLNKDLVGLTTKALHDLIKAMKELIKAFHSLIKVMTGFIKAHKGFVSSLAASRDTLHWGC